MIVMRADATDQQVKHVEERLAHFGLGAVTLHGQERIAIAAIGTNALEHLEQMLTLPGVAEVVPISRPFKLASREVRPTDTIVKIGNVEVGAGRPLVMMAGPCSVETLEQTVTTAKAVAALGANILRGGAYKPSTSPYNFRGLGEPGLEILDEARKASGLPVITEVLTPTDVPIVVAVADCLQVGARNMQNFALLDAVGEQRERPVVLKRGLSATIEEFLLAAEYILARGNPNVILCERGIRTFEKYTRNTFDVSAIPLLKRLTHLPVIGDPSHGTGKWYLVRPMSMASIAAGADGLMIEVHPNPDHALSDGAQSLTPNNFGELAADVRVLAEALSRPFAEPPAALASA